MRHEPKAGGFILLEKMFEIIELEQRSLFFSLIFKFQFPGINTNNC